MIAQWKEFHIHGATMKKALKAVRQIFTDCGTCKEGPLAPIKKYPKREYQMKEGTQRKKRGNTTVHWVRGLQTNNNNTVMIRSKESNSHRAGGGGHQ